MNNPGTVLLTISDMSVVEAEMEVDETDIPHVKLGQKAKLTFDAYPEKKYDGVVTEIGGSPITKSALGTDSTAVNFKVKVQLDDPPAEHPPRLLRLGRDRDRPARRRPRDPDPGARRRRRGVAQAPREGEEADADADARRADRQGRRRRTSRGSSSSKKDGTVDFRKVKTGITAELQIEVVEGLAEGDEIVTGPFKALRALRIGDRVKVDNSRRAPRDEQELVGLRC